MRLTCENCGAPVSARNVNVQTMTAVCAACDAVFQFEPAALSKAKRKKHNQPRTFDVTDADDEVTIDYVWRRNLGRLEISILSVCVLVVIFLTPIVLNLLMRITHIGELVGVGILGALVLGCLYMLATSAVNRTRIHLNSEQFTVRHGPIYWPGITLLTHEIESFSLKPLENMESYLELKVNTHDDRSRNIDVMQGDHARFTFQQLEQTLSVITDANAPAIDRLTDRLDEVRISEEGELILPDDDTRSARR